jgi:hypothetical protein
MQRVSMVGVLYKPLPLVQHTILLVCIYISQASPTDVCRHTQEDDACFDVVFFFNTTERGRVKKPLPYWSFHQFALCFFFCRFCCCCGPRRMSPRLQWYAVWSLVLGTPPHCIYHTSHTCICLCPTGPIVIIEVPAASLSYPSLLFPP